MDYAQMIKDSVKMPEIINFYGFKVSNRNRIPCPIHNGKDANLGFKSDMWHCFVCGEKGDQISFVQKVFNLTFQEAVNKLNDDFGLGFPIGKSIEKEKRLELEKRTAERRRKIEEHRKKGERLRSAYWSAFDEWLRLDRLLRGNRPKYYWEELKPCFVEAITKIDYARYVLDCAETELREYERSCN